MSEQLKGVPERGGREGEFAEYKLAIRKFLQEQFPPAGSAKRANRPSWGFDFDMSDPEQGMIATIRSGNFKIESLVVHPGPDSEKLSFHFYIGRMEFHITRKAADRIRELMGTEK